MECTQRIVCKAVIIAMDEENRTRKKVRDNHTRIRETLVDKDLETYYLHNFCTTL